MKRKGIEYLVLVLIIILSLVFIQSYIQRGVQGRLKSASDDVGDQFARYEPYYKTPYSVAEQSNKTTQDHSTVKGNVIRKLIRTANINLRVEDGEKALQDIMALVHKRNGIIINSRLNGRADEQKSGTAIFKVLPEYFGTTLEALRKIGDVENETISTEDVTEQYVDLEARLKNFMRVQDRLVKILAEKAHEVEDILNVEKELARVGAEIEALEGKMKYLDRQVGLSTITVYFHENELAVFKSLDVKDKFKDALRTSAEVCVNVFNGVIICIAALLPILLWGSVITGIVVGIKKTIRRKNK